MRCPRCDRVLDLSDYILRDCCPYCFKILTLKEDRENGKND